MWDEITYPFRNINGANFGDWELIRNFIPRFTERMITYPSWDPSWSILILIKGVIEGRCMEVFDAFIHNYIMAGHAIVVVKDITLLFYHGNAVILTLWLWLNDGKWFVWCKFSYFNNHLWLVKNKNHLKPRYTAPCNFLTKRAWVSQQCTLVVAKACNISHYLNS